MKNVPLTLIAGPCVIENENLLYEVAGNLKNICNKFGIRFIFKSSFDKANRTSVNSFRGPGLDKGLEILSKVKKELDLEILTDIHEPSQAEMLADVVDVIQIPAFLCRQTDLLVATANAVKNKDICMNVKKGQFIAPWDMKQVINKIVETGIETSSGKIWLTERGSCFGYNALVVDFRSLPQLKEFGCPVIFDATHSVQQPGGKGTSTGGQREFVSTLSRAAIAVGVDGLFMEVHPNPDSALSDGPNMVPLNRVEKLLEQLLNIKSSLGNDFAVSTI